MDSLEHGLIETDLSHPLSKVRDSRVQRIEVLGINVHLVQPEEARDVVLSWFDGPRRFHYVSSTNINNLINAIESPLFFDVTNTAELSLPDGMPLVWYGRYLGYRMPKKCGIEEFMDEIFELSNQGHDFKHYFYGNTQEVLDDLKTELLKKYPKLNIVGMHSPPFRPLSDDEQKQDIDRINDAGADFLWVSLGCPKQEVWLYENRHKLNAVAGGGAGAVFNFMAKHTVSAPTFVKYAGLEWLLRLLCNPKRLARRYLIKYPKFFMIFFKSRPWQRRSA
jgi:N-acetylglucosaminyldiphosphoundecaprenol N-acetyl-beta-D-mannosaminyltransferase